MQTHTPVLATEFVDALCVDPDGRYVDATFGRGGHSRLLLRRLSSRGRLLALDRDPEAVAAAADLEGDPRFRILHCAFADLAQALDRVGWDLVDGVGFDLGLSSPQLDDARRGFAFSRAGPLDMRMDLSGGETLGQRLMRVRERDLVSILRRYGDERYAVRIARAILRARDQGRLESTADLENICFHAVPPQARHGRTHPATRTFQALRIWVNDEMEQLEKGLAAAIDRLHPGGRLAVISFHSGEDRLVREMIEAEVHPCICPPQFPYCTCGRRPRMRWIRKKPLRASQKEIARNPRSRTARLRVAERLA